MAFLEIFNHVIKFPTMTSNKSLSDVTFLMNNNWNFNQFLKQFYHMASEDLEYTQLFSGLGSAGFLLKQGILLFSKDALN